MNKGLKELVSSSIIEIEITTGHNTVPDYITLDFNPIIATELHVGDKLTINLYDFKMDKFENLWKDYFTGGIDLLKQYIPFIAMNHPMVISIQDRSFSKGGSFIWLKGKMEL